MGKRRLCVLTTGRQDFGILRSTLLLLREAADFELLLVVGGMHLDARFGERAALIRAENLPVAAELDFIGESSDPAEDSARALGRMAAVLAAQQPDALLLVGDRSETLAAAHAAVLCAVPIAHLHGGEETEGAVDNVFRHAITKLSHLHLVSNAQHATRVVQMGEPPESVVVVGAPGLDNRFRSDLPGREELQDIVGTPLTDPVVIVTMHPTTLGGRPTDEVGAVAAAMARVPATYVITQPNSDAGSASIREFWQSWAAGRKSVAVVDALGERAYWGLLKHAAAVLGNSSSGIIEAPALGVPVIDVGDRQRGRAPLSPVRRVPAEADAIAEALSGALNGGAGAAARQRGTPEGPAAPRVMAALRSWHPPRPPRKAFVMLEQPCDP